MNGVFISAQRSLGAGGVIRLLATLSDDDREVLDGEVAASFPHSFINKGIRHYRLGLHQAVAHLLQNSDDCDLVLLGNDVVLTGIVSILQPEMSVEILPDPSLSSREVEDLLDCVPANLKISVHPPGAIPWDMPATKTVVAIGVSAAHDQVLISDAAVKQIGALRGTRFLGDIVALLPLGNQACGSRPAGWSLVAMSEFRTLAMPEAICSIPAQI